MSTSVSIFCLRATANYYNSNTIRSSLLAKSASNFTYLPVRWKANSTGPKNFLPVYMRNLRKGLAHLRRDPVMAAQIDKFGVINYRVPKDRFENLVSTIIGQQLSNKAADTIYGRVAKVIGTVTPQNILSTSDLALRTAGTSWAKIRSLKDLSQKILDKSVQLDKLDQMSDEKVISHLTSVKGIGSWTAHMKLMFTLHRPDIMPIDDRGIQNAMIKLYKLKDNKNLKNQILKISKSWQPYRTLACWYLWKSLDNS